MRNGSRKTSFEDALLGSPPDTILPSQFFELAGAQTFSSEQRLMLAVLADVINVLSAYRVSPNPCKRRSFNEAAAWVFTRRIRCPLSFDHVCDALGMDVDCLRKRLSGLISAHGSNLRRLRPKETTRIQGPTVTLVRRGRHRAQQGRNARVYKDSSPAPAKNPEDSEGQES